MRHDLTVTDAACSSRLEEESHVGGQILVPRPGELAERTEVYDVNALYPSVMRDFRLPYRRRDFLTYCNPNELRRLMSQHACIARVLIDTPVIPLPETGPAAPHWRVCRFWTTLCGAELDTAVHNDLIVQVGQVAAYDADVIFGDVVCYFWSMRNLMEKAGRPLAAKLFKLLAVSLYGAWAKATHTYRRSPEYDRPGAWGQFRIMDDVEKTVKSGRYIAGQAETIGPRKRGRDSIPAIAAVIASQARARMAVYRGIAGPGDVYYQYVDELHVAPAGGARLVESGVVDPDQMGSLRKKRCNEQATYYGANLYTANGLLYAGQLTAGWQSRSDGCWHFDAPETLRQTISRVPDGVLRVLERTYRVPAGLVGLPGSCSAPTRQV